MVECPACAGPSALGGGCATCDGTTKVTVEVREYFLAEYSAREEALATAIEKIKTLDFNQYEKEKLAEIGIIF